MPSSKSATPASKKQTPMPGPKSAAYKKIVAASKKAGATKSPIKSSKKRPGVAYATVAARQRALERIKRAIWCHLDQINNGIIHLAIAGNYNAAKALFDIAGVYSLPPLEEESQSQAPPQPMLPAQPFAPNTTPPAIDAFFQSIGIEPLREEPGLAAAAL
ncbi:MAG: hypothetical protein WA655_01280 [Candidatus Korobacteraceae bacterium]